MYNIILFGPPGIGKTTYIGLLKVAGERAVDLEDLYPGKVRFRVINEVKPGNCFFGGADLDPKRKYPSTIKVFLSMDQEAYEQRRAQRDAKVPGKENQAQHLIADWMKDVDYDHIIDVDRPFEEVLKDLRSLKSKN